MITKEQLATEAPNGRAFAVVNDLVHDPDRYFEELQQLALTMASHIDAQAARIAALEQDAARLDSGCIRTLERDDFGEEHYCIRNGINLRAAIDAAISTQAATERP